MGVGLFVFGLASLVYPPLKAIIGSVTTSAALMLGGLAPVVGGWFPAHRHGQLLGMVGGNVLRVASLRPRRLPVPDRP